MTHPNYERDKAEAQAVYDRLMRETHTVVLQARAPVPPQKLPSFWRRVAKVLREEAEKRARNLASRRERYRQRKSETE